jgi:hypothetical protein
MPRPLLAGMLAEVIFVSRDGPVLGVAELLSPVSATLKCLQPFKFIMIDDDSYRRLNGLILNSGGMVSGGQASIADSIMGNASTWNVV